MDETLDKGSIIAQKLVRKKAGETLRSSYEELDGTAVKSVIDTYELTTAEFKRRLQAVLYTEGDRK